MKTIALIISSICRATIPQEVLDLVEKAGIMPIPPELMDARELRITGGGWSIPASLEPHRGQWLPTVSRTTADELIDQGRGEPLPQSLLVYERGQYLADTGISNEEFDRVEASDAELVVVAVIGNNRSPLTVLRNLAETKLHIQCGDESCFDHYYKLVKDLKAQANDALEAEGNTFLIE